MLLPKINQIGSTHLFLLVTVLIGVLAVSFLLLKDPIQNLINPNPKTGVKAVVDTPFVSAVGAQLYLKGLPYQFDGVNAYELATSNTTAGCGGMINNLDSFFSSLRPNSVVRMWAFQGAIATNTKTKQLDWSRLDTVVNFAQYYNQKLILVLSSQSGQCDDGHWKDSNWYNGGYTSAYNDDGRGLAPMDYLDYVKALVNRYQNSTAIAMYELVSEPEAADCPTGYSGEGCYAHQTCPSETNATKALRSFYDNVGGVIKQIDPNHLIESGAMGSGQCGGVYTDYQYIHQSPGVDVASYHDYGADTTPMPGDPYNGLQERLTQMNSIGKPLIVGEVGMKGHANLTNCPTLDSRAANFKAKMDAQFAAGLAGFIPWDWTPNDQGLCTYDLNPGDPTLSLLYNYSLSMSQIPTDTPLPTASPSPTPPTSTKLGALDIASYCSYLKQPAPVLTGGVWYCGTTQTDLGRGCQWQYNNVYAYATQTVYGNSNSYTCYLPPNAPTPTPAPSATPYNGPVSTKLGPADLTSYCTYLKQPAPVLDNGVWYCGSGGAQIDLSRECQWQYNNNQAYATQTVYGNSNSYTCFLPPQQTPKPSPTPIPPTPSPTPMPTPTPTPTPRAPINLGGLNLSGYCNTLGSSGAYVASGGIWMCNGGVTINITSACQWQYKNPSAYSKQIYAGNPYSWTCYY